MRTFFNPPAIRPVATVSPQGHNLVATNDAAKNSNYEISRPGNESVDDRSNKIVTNSGIHGFERSPLSQTSPSSIVTASHPSTNNL